MTMKITTRANGRKYAVLKGAPGVGSKRISLKTKSEKDAKKIAAEADLPRLERALQAGALSANAISALTHGRRVALTELLDRWTESARYRNESPATTHANRLKVERWLRVADIAKLTPAAVTPAHLYDYINAVDERSHGTRARQLGAIIPFLTFVSTATHALKPEVLEVRINLRAMTHAQREKKAVRPFTAVEQDAILSHLDTEYGEVLKDAAADPKRNKEAVELAGFWLFGTILARAAGFRLGDIAQIEWECIAQPGHLIVWTDKRDRRVKLPINDKVTPGLARALGRIPDSGDRYVFPSMAERYSDPSRRPWFSTTYGRILQGLGIEGATFHSWRHTAISRWKAEGFDIEACADYAGHSSTKTTEGYVHG